MIVAGEHGTHRRTLEALLPFVVAAALLLLGLWMRWPIVTYDGPPDQDAITQFMVDEFAYSDIASLYFRDNLTDHPRPYLDYPLEYPVGIGFLIYLLNLATSSMPQYFLLTSLAMTVSALWTAVLVLNFPRGRVWLFALSPALAFYVNLNWDMWGVLLMSVSLLLFARERDRWGAAVLAAAVWTKFFPVLFLPLVMMDRFCHKGRRAALEVAGVFALASAAINAPVLLLSPGGWWHFFAYNAERRGEIGLWALFDPAWLSTDEINRVSVLLVLWGLVVLLVLQRRSPPGSWLLACPALLAWFFFLGKVYSPQYSLWIVVLLAVVGASAVLAVAWSALDVLYFAASFVMLGLVQYGDAAGWFLDHALEPAAILREGMLLVVIGWCVKQMRDSARSHGERPRGSPAV